MAFYFAVSPKVRMTTSNDVKLSIEEVKCINKLQFFTGFNAIFYKDNNQKGYIEQMHNELGVIPEKPYVSSKFEKFTSVDGKIEDMFHTSNDNIPYELNLKFIKPIRIGTGRIGSVRNHELYDLFKKMDQIIQNKEKLI